MSLDDVAVLEYFDDVNDVGDDVGLDDLDSGSIGVVVVAVKVYDVGADFEDGESPSLCIACVLGCLWVASGGKLALCLASGVTVGESATTYG